MGEGVARGLGGEVASSENRRDRGVSVHHSDGTKKTRNSLLLLPPIPFLIVPRLPSLVETLEFLVHVPRFELPLRAREEHRVGFELLKVFLGLRGWWRGDGFGGLRANESEPWARRRAKGEGRGKMVSSRVSRSCPLQSLPRPRKHIERSGLTPTISSSAQKLTNLPSFVLNLSSPPNPSVSLSFPFLLDRSGFPSNLLSSSFMSSFSRFDFRLFSR